MHRQRKYRGIFDVCIPNAAPGGLLENTACFFAQSVFKGLLNLKSRTLTVRNVKITIFILLAFTTFFFTPLYAAPDSLPGSISFLSGDVTINRPTVPGQSINAKIGMNVAENDTVETGPAARCEITFQGKYVIRCDEKTKLLIDLANLAFSKWSSPYGKLWMIVKPLLQSEGITVSSPTSAAAIKGTVFSIEADSNSAKYSVYRGAIAVTPVAAAGLKRDTGLRVETGSELTLIGNFDRFLHRSEESFEEYQKDQQASFAKYRKEQQRGVDSLQKAQEVGVEKRMERERSSFKSLGAYKYSIKALDTTTISNWVIWNKKRDNAVKW